MSASPPGHTGAVGGVLNMARGFGTALGVALAGALFAGVAGPSGVAVVNAGHGLTVALATLGCLALATGVALLLHGRRHERSYTSTTHSEVYSCQA